MRAALKPRAHVRRSRAGIHRRWWFWTLIVAVLLGVAAAGAFAIATRAIEAKSELESAQALVPQLKTEAVALDIESATATFDVITGHTARAVDVTDDTVWRIGEFVPIIGKNLTVVRELAAVTDQVMADVAAPLIGVAGNIDPASFAPKDGAIDLQPLVDAEPAVQEATTGAAAAVAALGAIDTGGTISQVSGAKDQLVVLLDDLGPTLETLNTVLPLLPPALGSKAPRTYALMFQNPAEARSLGGTALSFALIRVDHGRIELVETRPAGFSNFDRYPEGVIAVPDGAGEVYPDFIGTFIANATTRPSFTTAAQITQETWKRQFGFPVDGVLSVDPVALGYILRATDPITLSTGDILTSESLVPFLLNDIYQRFDSGNYTLDNREQDLVYAEAVDATFGRITGGPLDPNLLIEALLQGWDERRLLYWSANEAEQAQLAEIGLNGEIPTSDAETERVGLYFHDNVGAKINFYLTQAVRLSAASCGEDGLQSNRVSVDLTNSLDPSIVDSRTSSVLGNWQREGVQKGAQRIWSLLYAPPGAQMTGATIAGEPVPLADLHDAEFPVAKLTVTVPPGETVTVTYDFVSAEAGEKTFEAQVTPMVNPATITTEPLDCGTVDRG